MTVSRPAGHSSASARRKARSARGPRPTDGSARAPGHSSRRSARIRAGESARPAGAGPEGARSRPAGARRPVARVSSATSGRVTMSAWTSSVNSQVSGQLFASARGARPRAIWTRARSTAESRAKPGRATMAASGARCLSGSSAQASRAFSRWGSANPPQALRVTAAALASLLTLGDSPPSRPGKASAAACGSSVRARARKKSWLEPPAVVTRPERPAERPAASSDGAAACARRRASRRAARGSVAAWSSSPGSARSTEGERRTRNNKGLAASSACTR